MGELHRRQRAPAGPVPRLRPRRRRMGDHHPRFLPHPRRQAAIRSAALSDGVLVRLDRGPPAHPAPDAARQQHLGTLDRGRPVGGHHPRRRTDPCGLHRGEPCVLGPLPGRRVPRPVPRRGGRLPPSGAGRGLPRPEEPARRAVAPAARRPARPPALRGEGPRGDGHARRARPRGRSGARPRRADAEHLHAVVAYIDEHLDRQLRIEELARMACMSPTKFKADFRAANGCTVGQYIRASRMSRAEVLLRHSDMTIGQVGRQVGYHCASRFSQLFKREKGMLPSEFRRARTQQEPL
ncbi:helix-turn-helix domain-containing protein [Propionibacterium australiense]|nr:helix-turn-helix domain-containing protein [Propionibacterium australiense]